MTRTSLRTSIAAAAVVLALASTSAAQYGGDASGREGGGPRYKGQFAQDWEAGRVPTDAEIAAHLGIARGSPVLEIRRVAQGLGGEPVEWRVSHVNTARHEYGVDLG